MSFCPDPGQPVAWQTIERLPWFEALRGSTQNPTHHAEGDVLTHVRLVGDRLVESAEWQNADATDRLVVFAAMLLHDVAKPRTRTVVDGVIGNPRHARLGALDARAILWRQDFPPRLREQVCALITAHQVPFWLLDRATWDARRIVVQTSLQVSNRLLAMLATADAKGRICDDQAGLVEAVELYREAARDWQCYDAPFVFAGDETRLRYFERPDTRTPDGMVFDTAGDTFQMIILSGLPGSGKSTWIAAQGQDLPIVSLDALRAESGVSYRDDQGQVLQASKELARTYLRQQQSFVWDATNLSRLTRDPLVRLARDYGALVRMVHVETSHAQALSRNRTRGAKMIPQTVLDRMLARWDPPTLVECHRLERHSDNRAF